MPPDSAATVKGETLVLRSATVTEWKDVGALVTSIDMADARAGLLPQLQQYLHGGGFADAAGAGVLGGDAVDFKRTGFDVAFGWRKHGGLPTQTVQMLTKLEGAQAPYSLHRREFCGNNKQAARHGDYTANAEARTGGAPQNSSSNTDSINAACR